MLDSPAFARLLWSESTCARSGKHARTRRSVIDRSIDPLCLLVSCCRRAACVRVCLRFRWPCSLSCCRCCRCWWRRSSEHTTHRALDHSARPSVLPLVSSRRSLVDSHTSVVLGVFARSHSLIHSLPHSFARVQAKRIRLIICSAGVVGVFRLCLVVVAVCSVDCLGSSMCFSTIASALQTSLVATHDAHTKSKSKVKRCAHTTELLCFERPSVSRQVSCVLCACVCSRDSQRERESEPSGDRARTECEHL